MDGWTATNFNTAAKGSTNNDGYASEAYAGWGSLEKTNYSLTQSITLPAGSYELVNYSFYREGQAYNTDASTSRAYLKAGDNQTLIKTLGSITASGYANSQAEGANVFSTMMYRNTLDFTLDEEKTIEIGVTGTFTQAKSWCIVGGFQLLDMKQTPNAQDVTYLLTNPGFEYRDMTGWTLSSSDAFGTQSNTSFTAKAGGYYAEKWQSSSSGALSDRSMSQSLTGLTNGKYRLSAYIYHGSTDYKTPGTGAYISAGDKTTDITGGLDKYSVTANVTDGTLTVAAGLKSATSNWVAFDRFTLEYLPNTISQDDAKAIIEQAEALYNTPMNGDVLTALTQAANDLDANMDADSYEALQTAIANANTSIANYKTAKTYLDAASSLDEAGQTSYAADATIKAVQTAYNDASLVAVTSDQITAMNTALATAAKAQTTANSDMTAAIINPSFEQDIATGWTQSGTISFKQQNNNSFGKKTGTYYAEAWEPKGTLDINQTLTALHAGVYRLSVKAKARGVTSASVYAGDNSTALTIADSESDYTVEFATEGESTDVKIGLTAVGTGAGSSWVAFDNFTLTYVSASLPDVTAVTGKMNSEVESAQTTAITAYNSSKTVANYNAAVAAIAAAQASVNAYTTANTELERRLAIVNSTNFYTATAKATYYDDVKTKYDAKTLTTAEANALSNLADRDFLGSTFGFNSSTTTGTGDYIYGNTWSTENAGSGDAADFKTPFYETWVKDGTNLSKNDYTGSLVVANAGKYKITLKVRVRINSGSAATGVTMDVNGGTAVTITGNQIGTTERYINTYTLEGTVGDDKTLKLNIHVADGTNVSWISFRDINYEYIPTATIGSAGWATYVATEDVDLTNTGLTAYTTKYYASTITLTPISDNLIPSGAAVVLKGTAGTYDLTSATSTVADLSGNALKASDGTVKGGNSIWVLTSKDGQTGFAPTASTLTLPANKGYLEISDGGAKSFIAIGDGTATGINGIAAESVDNGDVYNVAGQKVSNSYKGLVIKNGKKYLRK